MSRDIGSLFSLIRENYMSFNGMNNKKEMFKMMDVAILIIAVVYTLVNMVYLGVTLNMLHKMKGLFDKYVKFAEKAMDDLDDEF